MADEYTEKSETSEPSPQETRLWRWLQQAADESSRVRREKAQFDRFDHWMDLYRGKHFPTTMPSYRPPVVVNELQSLVLSEASDLSDAEFRVYVMKDPRTGGRDEAAERALRAVWKREQVPLRLIEAIVWYLVCGTGFLRVGWDPDAFYGFGDVVLDAPDPRLILPDPDAEDDRKWAFVLFETVMDLAEIRRLFPLRGHLVKPDEEYSDQEHSVGTSREHAPVSLMPGYPYHGPLTEGDTLLSKYPGYKKARSRIIVAFVKDDTTEQVVEEVLGPDGTPLRDETGNPRMQEIYKLKYPGGRQIIAANGRVLYDGPNTNPGGDFGILRVVLEPTLGSFWGTGFIQKTGDLQLAADKLASAVVENAVRLNNGIVVAKGNTGIDWETFAGLPGQIVQLNRDADFSIEYPNPMPTDMVQAPWRLLDMQRRILGFPDPRTGLPGRGNVSPELTETEISQSQGLTRLRARQLYYVVQRLAEMIFARMASGYTLERQIPATEGNEFKPVVWEPLERPERYAVYVDPATFQVMSQSMLRRLSAALYRMNAIDRRALLEVVGWPDWEQVASRLDQSEKLAAMAKIKAQARRSSR